MHGIVSSLGGGKEVNWILTHKDRADVDEGRSAPGDMADVKTLIKAWDPVFQKIVGACKECLDWKLVYRDPPPTVSGSEC